MQSILGGRLPKRGSSHLLQRPEVPLRAYKSTHKQVLQVHRENLHDPALNLQYPGAARASSCSHGPQWSRHVRACKLLWQHSPEEGSKVQEEQQGRLPARVCLTCP